MKPATLTPVYVVMYARMAEAARSCGYALAVHGSLARDLDVVAIPWTEQATSADEVVRAMAEVTARRVGGDLVIGYQPDGTPRPHGRVGYSIPFASTDGLQPDGYVDISVMPRSRDPNAAQSERQTPDATEAPPARDFMKPTDPAPVVAAALPEEVEETLRDVADGHEWNVDAETFDGKIAAHRAAISSALGARDARYATEAKALQFQRARTIEFRDRVIATEEALRAAESRASAAADLLRAIVPPNPIMGCCDLLMADDGGWERWAERARAFLDGEAG